MIPVHLYVKALTCEVPRDLQKLVPVSRQEQSIQVLGFVKLPQLSLIKSQHILGLCMNRS